MIAEAVPAAAAVDAEQQILGILIHDWRLYPTAAARITGADFYRHAHRLIWLAMVDLHRDGKPWDLVLLADAMTTTGSIDDVGGLAYLSECLTGVATTLHLRHYIGRVVEASAQRRIQRLGDELRQEAASADPVALATRIAGTLADIATECDTTDRAFKATVHDAVTAILDGVDHELTVRTGFPTLDGILHGLSSGDLALLAARPSIGKTALALNIAEHVATAGTPVAIVSLEMSARQVTERLLATVSGIHLPRLKTRTGFDPHTLTAAAGRLAVMPIALTDRAAMTVAEIRAFAHAAVKAHGPCLLVVDYLGMIRSDDRHENRNLEVAAISRGLKAIAKDLAMPVLALSQLSRKPEQRTDRKPALSDLRDSGALEQDADVVMLLHRENRAAREAELEVAKHRNGPTGEVALVFDGPSCRFTETQAPVSFRPRPVGAA